MLCSPSSISSGAHDTNNYKSKKTNSEHSGEIIMSEFTRRSFIGKTAVAIGSFAALQKIAGADRSKTDPGPANPMLDGQNPDSTWPPVTDSKSLVQNFKYPLQVAMWNPGSGHQ